MLLLALDTSGSTVTVAVHDGSQVVAEVGSDRTMAHGEQLAPAIRDCLRRADVTASDLTDVAVGVGPGPFTGLRVGVVTALTLADTLGLRAHGLCSLDAMAHAALEEGLTGGAPFVIAADARRKEVYWAAYDDGGRTTGPAVDKPATLAQLHPRVPVLGPGGRLYSDLLPGVGDAGDGGAGDGQEPLTVRAGALAAAVLGERFATLPLEPLYLRRPDAVEPGAPKLA